MLMNKIILVILFFISFQLSFAQVPLSNNEAEKFRKQALIKANSIKSIVSEFTQHKRISFLNNEIITIGNLVFKSPNTIKWEYTSPYHYSIIFSKNKLYINDGGEKNSIDITSNTIFKSLNDLIVNTINGSMFDDNKYIISYFKLNENYLVKFLPKEEKINGLVTAFELVFHKETYDVIEVKMIESSNDYTIIIFKNKTLNTLIDDAIFNN